jgi:hypothetical protein
MEDLFFKIVIVILLIALLFFMLACPFIILNIEDNKNENQDVQAIIKKAGNEYIEIPVESYTTYRGTAKIISKSGEKYTTSDYTIIERKLGG